MCQRNDSQLAELEHAYDTVNEASNSCSASLEFELDRELVRDRLQAQASTNWMQRSREAQSALGMGP